MHYTIKQLIGSPLNELEKVEIYLAQTANRYDHQAVMGSITTLNLLGHDVAETPPTGKNGSYSYSVTKAGF